MGVVLAEYMKYVEILSTAHLYAVWDLSKTTPIPRNQEYPILLMLGQDDLGS